MSPGDSIPIRFTKPGRPAADSSFTTKSRNDSPGAANFGLSPAAGLTPTFQTLRQARQVLAARPPTMSGGLEGFPLPQYIMLVTDGGRVWSVRLMAKA